MKVTLDNQSVDPLALRHDEALRRPRYSQFESLSSQFLMHFSHSKKKQRSRSEDVFVRDQILRSQQWRVLRVSCHRKIIKDFFAQAFSYQLMSQAPRKIRRRATNRPSLFILASIIYHPKYKLQTSNSKGNQQSKAIKWKIVTQVHKWMWQGKR